MSRLCLSWKCWHLGGFLLFYLRGAVFRMPYLVSGVNTQCVMKRGDLLRSHLCFVSPCHLKMAVVLVDAFFSPPSLLVCSTVHHFSHLSPPKIWGNSISFSNVLQVDILVFKWAVWLFHFCFEFNKCHITMFFFFLKHDNNPQIPNNVIESIKKPSSVHNFIFH